MATLELRPHLDAQRWVVEIIADLLDRGERVSIHTVRDEMRTLIDDDREMKDAAAQWFIERGVPQIVREVLSRSRDDRLVDEKPDRFSRWYEHVGEGVHKPFLDLTGRELSSVIEHEDMRLDTEYQRQLFRRAVRKRISAGETVGKKLNPTDLENLYKRFANRKIEWKES